jgi:hypothetical protein
LNIFLTTWGAPQHLIDEVVTMILATKEHFAVFLDADKLYQQYCTPKAEKPYVA